MLNMKFQKIGNQEKEEENVPSGRSQKSFYLTAFLVYNGTPFFQIDFLTYFYTALQFNFIYEILSLHRFQHPHVDTSVINGMTSHKPLSRLQHTDQKQLLKAIWQLIDMQVYSHFEICTFMHPETQKKLQQANELILNCLQLSLSLQSQYKVFVLLNKFSQFSLRKQYYILFFQCRLNFTFVCTFIQG